MRKICNNGERKTAQNLPKTEKIFQDGLKGERTIASLLNVFVLFMVYLQILQGVTLG